MGSGSARISKEETMLEWFIDTASEFAPKVNYMMNLVNLVTGLAFVLTNGALVYFIIRYRRRSENDETSRVNNSHTVEAVWTIVPSIVFVFFYIIGLKDFRELRAAQDEATKIRVTAKQWAWEFAYPASLRTDGKDRALKSYNVLYVEENKPVTLIMKSSDVIHSFFVPAFRVKEDVVGNIYTYVQFTPLISETQTNMKEAERKAFYALTGEQEGKIPQVKDQCVGYAPGTCATYTIYCTEYCGKDHSYMLGSVVVLKAELYRKKLAELEEASGAISPAEGEKIYGASGCKSCHSLDGSKLVGPSWKGLYGVKRKLTTGQEVLVDENYITEAILNPNSQVPEGYAPIMPPQDLSEEQILSVIEYIKTLK